MVIGFAHVAFVLAAIIERAQGLVQHNNAEQAQELVRLPPSFKKTWPTLGGTHELRGSSAMHRLKVPEVGFVNTPGDVNIAARGLQSACGATQPIEVVSPAYSDLEGCFFITDSATDTLYFSTNVASAVGIIESQGRTFWAAWFYKNGSPESNPTTVCYSTEDPGEVDATEVTAWLCDFDLDSAFEAATASEFTIDCGCSSASTTDSGDVIPAPAPTPPLGSDSCGDGDAFTIISDEFPETEGCYRDSGRTEEGEPVYTLTGMPFLGQQMVFASVDEDTDEAFWVVSFAAQTSSASLAETYCMSVEVASSVHPSEVAEWGCLIGSVTTTATDAAFSVVCGCSDSGTTTTPDDDTVADETPAPVVLATPSPVVPEAPAPVVPKTPSPVVPETPVPDAPETPAPVVPETPVIVVPETPSPVVPETPTPIVPETLAPVIDYADPGSPTSSDTISTCSNGVVGVESGNGRICCETVCGTCGGPGCYSRGDLKGGQCCTQKISREAELCDVSGLAPCVIGV